MSLSKTSICFILWPCENISLLDFKQKYILIGINLHKVKWDKLVKKDVMFADFEYCIFIFKQHNTNSVLGSVDFVKWNSTDTTLESPQYRNADYRQNCGGLLIFFLLLYTVLFHDHTSILICISDWLKCLNKRTQRQDTIASSLFLDSQMFCSISSPGPRFKMTTIW